MMGVGGLRQKPIRFMSSLYLQNIKEALLTERDERLINRFLNISVNIENY